MSRTLILRVVLVGLLLGASACDPGSSDTTELADASTTLPAVSSTTLATSEETTTSVVAEEATTTTVTTVAESYVLFLPGVDVPEIDQLTPTTGVGRRPLIEWSGIDNAHAYELTVFGAGGTIYWSAVGPETSIYLGGAPASDQSPGPQIQDGMSWAVVALDVDGNVIAQSRVRPINP